jgi:hypothetical protein
MNSGGVYYCINDPESNFLKRIYQKKYEDALRIVQEEKEICQ